MEISGGGNGGLCVAGLHPQRSRNSKMVLISYYLPGESDLSRGLTVFEDEAHEEVPNSDVYHEGQGQTSLAWRTRVG